MSNLPNSVIRLVPPTLRGGYCPDSWQEFANELVCGTQAQHGGERGTTFYNFGNTAPYPPYSEPPVDAACEVVWDFDFATERDLTPIVGPTPTFSRTTEGSYFDTDGLLKYAAIDTPRFTCTYNGASWVSKGILIEHRTSNRFGPSEDFEDAAWIKVATTVTKNVVVAPDGTTTGNQMFETAANSTHQIYQYLTDTSAGFTGSIFFKQGTARYVWVYVVTTGGKAAVCVADLQTGTITKTDKVGAILFAATIENCSNGWYRVGVATDSVTNLAGVAYGITDSATPTLDAGKVPVAYLGDPANYVYCWGAQFERSYAVSSYIRNPNPTNIVAGNNLSFVERGDDVCLISGGTFSGIWNASQGSIFAEYQYREIVAGEGCFACEVTAGSAPFGPENCLLVGSFSTYPTQLFDDAFQVYGAAIEVDIASSPSIGALTDIKNAVGFASNNFAMSINGAACQTSASGSIPTVSDFRLGSNVCFERLNAPITISRLKYYNCRLTNAELEALSS